MEAVIPAEVIENKIYLIRGQKVMLSMHLAELYGVETRILNQAVKRNANRFPEDFMFQINESEAMHLVSQNVIPHKKYFGRSDRPEPGVNARTPDPRQHEKSVDFPALYKEFLEKEKPVIEALFDQYKKLGGTFTA